MLTLYSWTTPNGRKISIMLEELGVPYVLKPVNLGKDEQFSPEFLVIAPNNKIPALVDDEAEGGRLALFESGAILTYLAEKHGRFLAKSGAARYQALVWLNWQVGGLGPMLGQLGFFEVMSKEKSELASKRFRTEAERLLEVLEKQLSANTYLAGDAYSIADIAVYPWLVTASTKLKEVIGETLAGKPAIQRWLALVGARPAVVRGMVLPAG